MKILFIIHSPNPPPGAGWVRISFFAKYLEKSGHSVRIGGAFSLKSIDKAGFNRWNGIPLINITPIIMTNNLVSFIFNIISSFFTSIPLILLSKSDIVIISVPPGELAFGSFIVAKLLKKYIVIDYRDEWEDHLIGIIKSKFYKKSYILLKNLMTRCYKKCNFLVTVTRPLSKSLSLRGIQKIKIIPNGADCNYFKPFYTNQERIQFRTSSGFDEEDFILIYSGFIGGYYRIDIVIKALKKVIGHISNIKLVVIGYGLDSQVDDLKELSKKLDIHNNVYFLGSKTDDLSKFISCCDIGIIPYDANPLWKNSLPVKSLEFLACGLPIVATVYKDSILGKLIEENELGIVSDPEDIDALADAIKKIYNSDVRISSKKAVSFIKKNYDRNYAAKEFMELLETVSKS